MSGTSGTSTDPGMAARRAALLDRLRRGESTGTRPVPEAPVGAETRASVAQQRFWVLEGNATEPATLHLSGLLRFAGTGLDPSRVLANVREMTARQPALRTVLRERDGELWQVVLPEIEVPFHEVRVRGERAEQRLAAAIEAARELAHRPFDLGAGPLFRVAMLVLDADTFLLMVTAHHIVSDGFSLSLMGHAAVLGQAEPIRRTFAEHAAAQRAALAGGGFRRDTDHWREVLRGAPPVTTFPPDHPRPATWSPAGANHTDELDPALVAGVRELAERTRRTPASIMLAAYLVVLSGWSGQRDVVAGMCTLGRADPDLDRVVGLFRNFAPVRWTGEGDGRFAGLAGHCQRAIFDAHDHAEIPAAALSAELVPAADPGRAPLYQTLINMVLVEDSGYCLRPPIRQTGCSFDLTLHIDELFGTYHLTWMYARALYEESSVIAFSATFRAVLARAVADPSAPVAELTELVRATARPVAPEVSP